MVGSGPARTLALDMAAPTDDPKTALRRTALLARRSLSEDERRDGAARAVERLLALRSLRQARNVLLYAALPDELDVGPLVAPLIAAGVRTLFPRVRGDELELVAARDLLALALGYRSVREPAGPSIDPAVVDVAVVPGTAFDVHGGRLGHGGGHYDRLLARLAEDTVTIGVCFSCQVVPRVPREEHDERVDLVVTEAAVHRREP